MTARGEALETIQALSVRAATAADRVALASPDWRAVAAIADEARLWADALGEIVDILEAHDHGQTDQPEKRIRAVVRRTR